MMKKCIIAILATGALIRAQRITPTPSCAISTQIGTYPASPLAYPKTSDRYAVQYSVDGGAFTDARVYISYYGGTNSSPYLSFSGYSTETSMSFVSISVQANASVQLRVTKLWNAPFLANDHVSIRPAAKSISADLQSDGTVLISRKTNTDFAGEQFILWWNRGTEGGALEALAFYLDPPYTRPTGPHVKVIAASSDLATNLSAFDTLDIEGIVAVPPRTGMASVPGGAVALSVPTNITSIFIGPGAWLQGKLHFLQTGTSQQRRIYGPGVLDVSRFEYDMRACSETSDYPDQGYPSISLEAAAKPDKFTLDGIVIIDQNLDATDPLADSTVNNVKVLGWNANNDGIHLSANTSVSNVFIRSGDDSLKMWSPSGTIRNATVWQDFNGAVVSLGWEISPVEGGLIDGLYVVKTDWQTPAVPSWNWTGLNDQNNGVFVSLNLPGTTYGATQPPVFRNIFIEDPPRLLFSLKIVPPRCTEHGLPAPCQGVNLTDKSILNLQIENLSSPASLVQNSVGFETLPQGYTLGGAAPGVALPYTLTGAMNIKFTNVMLTPPNGVATALSAANAAALGKLITNGLGVELTYAANSGPQISLVANAASEANSIAPNTWVEIKGTNLAPSGDSRIWGGSDFVDDQMPTSLDGVSVTVNGKAAFVYYISPTQIDILTPPDAMTGPVQVMVTNNGTVSAPFTAQAQIISPAFFLFNGGPYVAATHANGALLGPASLYPGSTVPAKPGETIVLYANGFGPSTVSVVSGSAMQSGTVLPLPVVKIGGIAADVAFAGLVSPGEYQFNVVVPASLTDGDQPVTATYNGQSTQSGTLITVQK